MTINTVSQNHPISADVLGDLAAAYHDAAVEYARSLAADGHLDQAHAVAAQRAELLAEAGLIYQQKAGNPLTATQALAG